MLKNVCIVFMTMQHSDITWARNHDRDDSHNFYWLIAQPYQEPYMTKIVRKDSGEPKVMQRTTKEPFKWVVYTKIRIWSSYTHHYADPDQYDFLWSVENKKQMFGRMFKLLFSIKLNPWRWPLYFQEIFKLWSVPPTKLIFNLIYEYESCRSLLQYIISCFLSFLEIYSTCPH